MLVIGTGARRPAAIVERRAQQTIDHRFRHAGDQRGRPRLCEARRARRHVRHGRHALGGDADLHRERLQLRPHQNALRQQSGLEDDRALRLDPLDRWRCPPVAQH